MRTDSFDKPFPLYNPDGTRNLRAAVANTHIVNHAGKTLALVESSLPYEITNDLETVGCYDFGGKLDDSMTAHPKICPTTGELHFFGYGNLFQPHVTYHRVDANGELTVNRPLEVKALTMMHDFALTEGHVIFMDPPIVFNLEVAATARATCRSAGMTTMAPAWECCAATTRSARCAGSRSTPATCSTSPTPTTVRMGNRSCCRRSDTPSCGGTTAASRPVGRCGTGPSTWPTARCASVSSTTERWSFRVSTTGWPARGPAIRSRSATPAWCAMTSIPEPPSSIGSAPGCPRWPREFAFVPSPSGPADESNGWYLGYVYDPTRDGSDLVILDASDFVGDPVARVRLPRRVPYGFHGNWIGA